MLRDIVRIDEELCNGCGECVPNCHEGALQIIDGKARLVSELMCDGLGACLGHCPEGALTIEQREAKPYDEVATLEEMLPKGKNTVLAHLKHLKEHGELDFLRQAFAYLDQSRSSLSFNLDELRVAVQRVCGPGVQEHQESAPQSQASGCPGARAQAFDLQAPALDAQPISAPSQLTHWPVQLHLINPMAPFFQGADLLVSADCVAFAMGGFHQSYLKGKALAIACPKLDDGQEIYAQKIKMLVESARVNTITVMIMEVPCCGGLLRMVSRALAECTRKVPLKLVVVSVRGDVLQDHWA